MISQTGTYALQATLYLARHPRRTPVAAATMARELGIPANYLAKILHRLAREGVMASVRGAQGGYHLADEPEALSVARVVRPFADMRTAGTCLLGGQPCDATRPCSAHARWSEWTGATRGMLEGTTVAELLEPSPRATQPSHDR
jgi:Rrf2 family protein